jgi:dihydroorotate dehydrogenase electron transfer subunit
MEECVTEGTAAYGRYLLPQPFPISEITVENSFTKTLTLAGTLAAVPGQFVMAWLPDLEEKPFSLAGADPIRLTVAAVGPFSRKLHDLQVGDRLWLRGPLGRGYCWPAPATPPQRTVVVGGGYGVAPLLFLARQILSSGHTVTAVIGARCASQLLLVEAFRALGVPVLLTTEDGSAGRTGLATDALAGLLAAGVADRVYACGPTGMLAAVAGLCGTAGVPVQIAWEALMRCGIGLCGSCEVGAGWLTCLDGPVFSFDPADPVNEPV